jgi:hypothetical protein
MQAPKEVVEDFRNHLYFSFKYLGLGEPTPKQYAMANKLQEGPNNFILQAGRGDGKSVIMACYASWLLLKDHNTTILVLSAAADKAIKFISQTRAILTQVPYMKYLEPQEFDKDSAFGFNVHARTKFGQDLSMTARGITSQITGLHADKIICDDIEIPENSDSPQAREKLWERCLELENVINKHDDTQVRFLGTPQSKDSVYNKLGGIYKIIKFPAVMPDLSSIEETEDVDSYILNLGIEAGESTQPERFPTEKLAEIEAKIGPTNFDLHYRLMTSSADQKKYPLRLEDLVVLDVDPEVFPVKVVHAKSEVNKRVSSFGMKGDLVYEPMHIEPKFVPYTQTAMFIDPSGRGADETAICIASFAHGYIVIHELTGIQGGYDTPTLKQICKLVNQYDINLIRFESNYGDGMFGKVLSPVIAQNCGQVAIEEYKVSGQKEARILSILEPVMAQHRLVIDTQAIQDKENQIQITRLQEKRGALKHDDRVDVLAAAVSYWTDALAIDPDREMEQKQQEEYKAQIKEWMSNRRGIALLGDRISGAILLNGKTPKTNGFGSSILKRQNKWR